jgi:hypothetical protein
VCYNIDTIKKENEVTKMKRVIITKEEMMENAMRRFGLENSWVIAFCNACELGILSHEALELLYIAKMEEIDEDDEGEI